MRIPTVTQVNLYAFHSRIFGAKATSNLPSSLIVNASEVNKDGVEDEDDLGYYPDGVKRTLTDDQIAMFRCSEIYALLRERQLKREKEKADADGHQSNLERSNQSHEKRDSRAPTARRLARELDNVVTETGDLDYGEDTATNLDTRNQPRDNIYGRKQVCYDDVDDDSTPSKCSVPSKPVEGKKIWWPTIGPQNTLT
ncbi:MAG: hypothetical protein LQ342_008477 [Letrouitia transgressa]|nr:MAG: hypothetical protein LQ342_008477 [Letrouitia transgressa]